MGVMGKNIAEQAARGLAVALIGVLCWLARDTLLQLRKIQADLVSIQLKLVTMEANAMTPEAVRQLIQLEMSRHESGH